jgi:hypothetical protein
LHGFHHIALLCQERVAKIGGPLNIVCQTLDHIGQPGKGLDARIPWLLGHGIGQSFVLQPRIFRQVLLELNDLDRISRCCKNLGQHRVRVERNRRYKRVQLIGGNLCSLVRRCLSLPSGRCDCQAVTWHKSHRTNDDNQASNSRTHSYWLRIHTAPSAYLRKRYGLKSSINLAHGISARTMRINAQQNLTNGSQMASRPTSQ